MDVCVSLTDLDDLHPRLSWSTYRTAAAAVLASSNSSWPVKLAVEYEDLPDVGSDALMLGIDGSAIAEEAIERVKRTFDAARLVEMAAIAVAGMILYYGGQREICDISLRGSGADYLVGDSLNLLEIAGRSRRVDFEPTWREKLARLRHQGARDFFIAIVEFETPSARLGYFAM